jgi:hypothetical protein
MSNVFIAPSAEDLVEFGATWPQEKPAPPPGRWSAGRALRAVGGLDESRLEPADRAYYTRLLVLIVGASVMATVSLSAALSMTTGAGMTGWPLLAGLGCGALIATNDLAITMPDPYRRRGWIPTAGRMAFAVLFGPMVALPLTAAIFAQDINHHLAEQRQVEAQHASVDFDARRPGIETAVAETHGPAVRAATFARDGAQEDLDRVRQAAAGQMQACNAEITGTGGSGLSVVDHGRAAGGHRDSGPGPSR